jgi:hypothetical protein
MHYLLFRVNEVAYQATGCKAELWLEISSVIAKVSPFGLMTPSKARGGETVTPRKRENARPRRARRDEKGETFVFFPAVNFKEEGGVWKTLKLALGERKSGAADVNVRVPSLSIGKASQMVFTFPEGR